MLLKVWCRPHWRGTETLVVGHEKQKDILEVQVKMAQLHFIFSFST